MDNMDLARYDMIEMLKDSGKERAIVADFFTGDALIYLSDKVDLNMLKIALKSGQFDKKVETK